METSYLIPLCLFLAAIAVRFSYERLKRCGRIGPRNRAVFVFVFIMMCVLWAGWFAMCPKDPLKLGLPEPLRWFGFGIFVIGLALAFGALIQLRGVENIDHLVTNGLFARIRHPMYTGFICWIIGWSLFHSAGASLIAGLVGIANILYWRHLEDNDLSGKYGDQYLVYRKMTWF